MATVKEAERLIERVQRQLDEADEFFESQGLKPEKVRDYLGRSISDAQRREAEEQARQDIEAVEDEVRRANAHAPQDGGASKPKRPRTMV